MSMVSNNDYSRHVPFLLFFPQCIYSHIQKRVSTLLGCILVRFIMAFVMVMLEKSVTQGHVCSRQGLYITQNNFNYLF